jgi:hypothetical protein
LPQLSIPQQLSIGTPPHEKIAFNTPHEKIAFNTPHEEIKERSDEGNVRQTPTVEILAKRGAIRG